MRCEIGRCIDLVNRPFIFNFVRLYIRNGECGMFHGVRQLEYNADQKTRYNRCNQKSDYPGTDTHHIDGKRYKYKSMYHFKDPEIKMIHQAHFLQGHFTHAFSEILIVVQNKYPEYIKHRV